MLFTKYITSDFRAEIQRTFPDTLIDPSLRRFIMYLAFGTWKDRSMDALSVSHKICSILEREHCCDLTNYNSGQFLKRMKKYLPGLLISEYIPTQQTRLVLNTGFTVSFDQIVAQEKERLLHTDIDQLVHYETGIKYNRRINKEQDETLLLNEVNTINNYVNVNQVQQDFLSYFNQLNSNSFSKVVRENIEEAITATYNFQFKNPAVKEQTLKTLIAIRQQPKPFYFATQNSCRLYSFGSSILQLKKEIRKVLTKGWVEFDIVNCHLAIIAKDWNVKLLQKLFSSNQTIWDFFCQLGFNLIEAKPYLKTLMYSLVFGASKKNMTQDLQRYGMTKKSIDLLFKEPLMKDILDCRKRQLDYALVDPRDCFGNIICHPEPDITKTYDQRPHRSVLAQRAQAVEMKMLSPIINYSKQNKDAILICLYQFDGFSVSVLDKRRTETHCKKIQDLLNLNIKNMGYNTTVEYKENK